jgi:hypothetical protein
MLISFEHRFLFIHVGKAAGTSIQRALQDHVTPLSHAWWRRALPMLGPLNRVGGMYRVVEFREHVTAAVVQRCLPASVYAGLYTFTFVRNPWDRLVSRYAYLCQTMAHRHHRLAKAMPDFATYVRWEIGRGSEHQHLFVTDRQGNLIVDLVGKFEKLQDDFATVGRRLGLPGELPRSNESRHRDYREYYDERTRRLVEEHFRRDIEMFGYDFNGAVPDRVGAR